MVTIVDKEFSRVSPHGETRSRIATASSELKGPFAFSQMMRNLVIIMEEVA